MLSKNNITKRLLFARGHRNWTVDDWKKVIWSDETKINRYMSDGIKWCWRQPHQRFLMKNVEGIIKHGGGSPMIWGCMTNQGVGDYVQNSWENYKSIVLHNFR